MTVGVAIIGAGFWGKNHVRVLKNISDVQVLGVYDVNKTISAEIKSIYNIPIYKNLEEVFNQKEIDVVTICTPTTTHFEITLQALEAGKHVLVEKPMTSTIKEAQQIINLSQKKGLFLSVGFIERFNPAVKHLKKSIETGKLGQIILIMARRVSQWPQRIGDIGVTKDSAIHDIDVMRHLLGSEVEEVYAQSGSLQHRFDDYSEIMIKFTGGTIGFIDVNWLTPKKVRHLIVTGNEATSHLDYIAQKVFFEGSQYTKQPVIKWVEPLLLELEHFIYCIKKGQTPSPSGVDGLKALTICEAALRSSDENRVVKISEYQ